MHGPDLTPRRSKPLKILTLDGGGLQAISTLMILNKILDTIAKQNGVPQRKPRPCDVFDTIAGIGAGGWLAILLGRFRMDITSCLSEWYRITECIAPRSRSEELRLRLLQHCFYDTDRLVEEVDRLTKVYDTGDFLFESDPGGARTCHVFVAALKADAKGYNLFRSYEIPKSAKLPRRLLDGPENPSSFKIARAFGVTGAAKYFTPPWTEHIANSGKIRFSDTKFPKPHNITELALDEMWAIYGTDVPLSAVVNIGPGLPNDVDFKQIARRFSWGLNNTAAHSATAVKWTKSTTPGGKRRSRQSSVPFPQPDDAEQESKRLSVRFQEDTAKVEPVSDPIPEHGPKRSATRTDTVGSVRNRGFDAKLKRLEDDIELDIKKKLSNIYPHASDIYYRLALPKAPKGCPQNDSSVSGLAFNATVGYLNESHVDIVIDEVVKLLPDISSPAS
ncbi:hypothetical protein MMC21_001262 [Puttea exsequens]|nr:hypothetical protein [Puttea exsequens]